MYIKLIRELGNDGVWPPNAWRVCSTNWHWAAAMQTSKRTKHRLLWHWFGQPRYPNAMKGKPNPLRAATHCFNFPFYVVQPTKPKPKNQIFDNTDFTIFILLDFFYILF